MPAAYPRKLVLSQDQVIELANNLRRIAKAIKDGQPEIAIQGLTFPIPLKNLTPVKALQQMAMYVEAAYQEQQGAKRVALAWDAEQREPMGHMTEKKAKTAKTRLKTRSKTP
jgi:hypothetical protein